MSRGPAAETFSLDRQVADQRVGHVEQSRSEDLGVGAGDEELVGPDRILGQSHNALDVAPVGRDDGGHCPELRRVDLVTDQGDYQAEAAGDAVGRFDDLEVDLDVAFPTEQQQFLDEVLARRNGDHEAQLESSPNDDLLHVLHPGPGGGEDVHETGGDTRSIRPRKANKDVLGVRDHTHDATRRPSLRTLKRSTWRAKTSPCRLGEASTVERMIQLYDTATQRVRPLELRDPGRCRSTSADQRSMPHRTSVTAAWPWSTTSFVATSLGPGSTVTFVSNITDIEDKIIDRAKSEGRPWRGDHRQMRGGSGGGGWIGSGWSGRITRRMPPSTWIR